MEWNLTMKPAAGERHVGFVGDRLEFELLVHGTSKSWSRCTARLRTTIGSGATIDREIIRAYETSASQRTEGCRDLPMQRTVSGFRLSLLLSETGFYWAKPFLVDENGQSHWPAGDNYGVSVHPNDYRTANLIYCAWPRLFGETRRKAVGEDQEKEERMRQWDRDGYALIPPSGTLRDLKGALGHIVDDLGCRIIHLLPVNPTPATFARFGRFGSPYAALDLTGVDASLVEFDQRTTGVQQFCELAREARRRQAKIILDLVINHTGWGSLLYENHPEWFRRHADGRFASPGAWGTIWEDLVELEHEDPKLGRQLAEVFLTWCRRGVNGFRCDAGYMVPLPMWRYLTARVRQEFPNTIFLLEGLGGSWEATERLLTQGGMQWAYSELFQNYSGGQVSWYLDYALLQSQCLGLYVHYSETHDNPRLAAKGKTWSLLRNRLCGLASVNGGYGFTCGVEWLAVEKISVHGRSGLNWESENHIVDELCRLNRLLANHPCFFDGAILRRLSESGSTVFALDRVSKDLQNRVLVLVNTDPDHQATLTLSQEAWKGVVSAADDTGTRKSHKVPKVDLLGQDMPAVYHREDGAVRLTMRPGAAYSLAATLKPAGSDGPEYRHFWALRAWVAETIHAVWPDGLQGEFDIDALVVLAVREPLSFLAATRSFRSSKDAGSWPEVLEAGRFPEVFPSVVLWEPIDRRRVVPLPPDHWLVVRDERPFEVRLLVEGDDRTPVYRCSTALSETVHLVCLDADRYPRGPVGIRLRYLDGGADELDGSLLLLAAEPQTEDDSNDGRWGKKTSLESPIVLLTNRRGGMARLSVDMGKIKSKYDSLLAANLHDSAPVDRHVLAKRMRLWVQIEHLVLTLNQDYLIAFSSGPPAIWRYLLDAGGGNWASIEICVDMVDELNATVIRCRRLKAADIPREDFARFRGSGRADSPPAFEPEKLDSLAVKLTARIDIEDRNFHWETLCNAAAEHHFVKYVHELGTGPGFVFCPALNRQLVVNSDCGVFRFQPEWCTGLPHSVEASRGQTGCGDAYSPGWFEAPLKVGQSVHYTLTAGLKKNIKMDSKRCFENRQKRTKAILRKAGMGAADGFGGRLARAADAFVVRRDDGMTVIAGYPWFLDWGRDSLICARGLLACGYQREVTQMLRVFGRFEESGTLPNSLHGEDTSNRDTSDAPLWFGMVCADLYATQGAKILNASLGTGAAAGRKRRTIGEVLRSIALGYLEGTPNGIRVDSDSGLVWSPSHFTWMDTNHPAGTPREGYPVEIQVLWIRLLRLLDESGIAQDRVSWKSLAERASESFQLRYWLEDRGFYADLLVAGAGVRAADAIVDSSLRCNYLFAISTGMVQGIRARRAVQAASRHLLVPGAIRSLAPLKVEVPLPVCAPDGSLLNDPDNPYWGRYEGDEDTRRKPAYHNGTAWTWMLGPFCEAVLRAWNFSPESVKTVRAWLGGAELLMREGCLGQLPEVLDGDAPHGQRGCDAQAWSVTEILRIWKLVVGSAAKLFSDAKDAES